MEVNLKPTLKAEFVMVLTEQEARAMAELSQFSSTDILDAIDRVSPALVRDYKAGLSSFFVGAKQLIFALGKMDAARKIVDAK